MLQPIHQLIVVCQSLTETEAGIQNNIIKTFGIQASDPICQKFPYFFYDTFIMRIFLHRLWSPLDMHHDVRHTGPGHIIKHPLIHRSSRNIVHDNRSLSSDDFFGYFCPESIDRNDRLRIMFPNQFHRLQQTSDFFPIVYIIGSGTGRISPDIDHVRPFIHNLMNAFDNFYLTQVSSTIIKRVWSYIQYPHHCRNSKIQFLIS